MVKLIGITDYKGREIRMLVCPNCNNEKESGKLCGSCGSELEPAAADGDDNQQAAAAETIETEGNNYSL